MRPTSATWLLSITLVLGSLDKAGAQAPDQASVLSVCCGTHISSDSPETPYVETFLAINPRDPRNLIATSMAGVNGSVHSRVYASRDEGHTWRRTQDVTGGDPIVYVDGNGTGFFGFLNKSGFLLTRSSDGGFSWETTVTLPGRGWDRPYLAFDNTGGKFNGRIYAGGTNTVTDVSGRDHQATVITFSSDNGKTFAPNTVLTGNSGLISDLLVTPDGKLVIAFRANPDLASPPLSPNASPLWTMVSDDGGVTFSPARMGPSIRSAGGIRMLKSHPAPRATIDLSNSRYRGTIYVTWTDFDGKKYAVRVAHSADLGNTWSFPVVVNDNINEGDPATPAIAVSEEGVVGVVFNDRRDDPKNSCFRLYFAASFDGGKTFLPNVRASDQPTCPLASGNWAASVVTFRPTRDGNEERGGPWISMLAMATRWQNGGDTQGLVAGRHGQFFSAWINGESGVMQLWLRELKVDQTLVEKRFKQSRTDLSRDLTIEVSDPKIDLATHTVSLKVRLVNPLKITIVGPFTIVLEDIVGTLKGLRALNSDNGEFGRGSTWDFVTGGSRELGPQQKSDERLLRWGFTEPDYEAAGVPLSVRFTILGQPQ